MTDARFAILTDGQQFYSDLDIGLFSGKQEERIAIGSLEDIYEHAERLHETVRAYSSQA